jgi:class 3 adenylate cyclase|tara:strand:- start:421 stop:609 length:189 start_codon:yes stop_codon:yes gene_type:complete
MQRNAPSTSKKVKAKGNEGLMDEDQLRFRTSANLGDVIVQDGDIFGNGINVGRPTGRFPNPT